MAVVDVTSFLAIQLLFITICSRIVSRLLLKNYNPPGILQFTNPLYYPHLIFATTLGTASSLFLLVFGEIINIFSKGARWQYWQFNLSLLLILVIIIIPWYQCFIFLRQVRGWRRKPAIYVTTTIWALYLLLFNQTTTLSQLTGGGQNINYSWLEFGIFRVSVLGITLTSVLSGFGVVNSPFMAWTTYTQHVSDFEYTVAQQAFDNILLTIQEKKSNLSRLQQLDDQNSQAMPHQKSVSFLDRLMSSIVGGSGQQESKLLEVEIRELEQLSVNMKFDLDELGRGRLRSQRSKTWKGKLNNAFGLVFAIYCIYRLLTTTLNVLLQRTGSGDPITNTLSLMIGHFGENVKLDTQFWSQQLSFWFAGVIVFGSVRGALKLLTKILRNFTHQFTISTSNTLLFVAHMLGMYFVSSVLMMQVSLPPDYRYLITSTLEHIEFTFFQRWSDIILVMSSLITAIILYVIHQTNDAKNLATDYADMQLSSIETGSVGTQNMNRRRLD